MSCTEESWQHCLGHPQAKIRRRQHGCQILTAQQRVTPQPDMQQNPDQRVMHALELMPVSQPGRQIKNFLDHLLACAGKLPRCYPGKGSFTQFSKFPTMPGKCRRACFKMMSVHSPGPVRSSVALFGFPLNSSQACAAICSQRSFRAGWPGAAAKTHCSTCRVRA